MSEKVKKLIDGGAEIVDMDRVYIRGDLICGNNVYIDVNVIFQGRVVLGDNVKIGANCILVNSSVADNSLIKPFSIIEDSEIGQNCFIGPYARISFGSSLGKESQVGNFVEVKKSNIMQNVKIHHLSFIEKAELATGVIVGAGSVTCDYDGQEINTTIIEKNAFIGSGSSLIAPIRIGSNATIGAGSTLSKDAPMNNLTIARSQEYSKDRKN